MYLEWPRQGSPWPVATSLWQEELHPPHPAKRSAAAGIKAATEELWEVGGGQSDQKAFMGRLLEGAQSARKCDAGHQS
jgi:hypothetical protein